jgi:hypothetical protein
VPGQVFQFRIIVKDTRGDTTTVPTSLTATDAALNINAQFPHIPGVIVVPEVFIIQTVFPRPKASFSFYNETFGIA